MNVSKQLAESHYADLSSKPFFAGALPEYGGFSVKGDCWNGWHRRPPGPMLCSKSRLTVQPTLPSILPWPQHPSMDVPPTSAGLVEYITSGPVVAIVLEGKNVVAQVCVAPGQRRLLHRQPMAAVQTPASNFAPALCLQGGLWFHISRSTHGDNLLAACPTCRRAT